MTPICSIPQTLGTRNFTLAMNEMRLPFNGGSPDDPTLLDFSAVQFCDPMATVALASFGAYRLRRSKQRVELGGWRPDSYLARVGVKRLLGYDDDYPHRRNDGERLTSVTEVADHTDRQKARRQLLDVLGIQHDGTRLVLDYCLEEILRNVEDHADSPTNALVQAQYYETRNEVVFAIADTGRGVLWNLRQRHQQLENDEEALIAALQPGVSGRNTRKGSNAGLGLTVSSSLVTGVNGTFQVASGTALRVLKKGRAETQLLEGGGWPGVIVAFSVPRNDALDWEANFEQVLGSY